jgi:hypothetical protein
MFQIEQFGQHEELFVEFELHIPGGYVLALFTTLNFVSFILLCT